jgi:hypothetical protein
MSAAQMQAVRVLFIQYSPKNAVIRRAEADATQELEFS